jgi:hypothetical protein
MQLLVNHIHTFTCTTDVKNAFTLFIIKKRRQNKNTEFLKPARLGESYRLIAVYLFQSRFV